MHDGHVEPSDSASSCPSHSVLPTDHLLFSAHTIHLPLIDRPKSPLLKSSEENPRVYPYSRLILLPNFVHNRPFLLSRFRPAQNWTYKSDHPSTLQRRRIYLLLTYALVTVAVTSNDSQDRRFVILPPGPNLHISIAASV
jgi:hypothetical protein